MLAASLGFWFLSLPYFYLLANGNYLSLLLIQCLISIPAGAYYATVPVMLSEMFPINLRCTVLSALYAIAAGLSAGLTPMLSLMLLKSTNNPMSPTLLIFALIGLSWMVIQLRHFRSRE